LLGRLTFATRLRRALPELCLVFLQNENLKNKIEKYATTAAQPKVDAEMERRLKLVFEPKRRNGYTEVLALPRIEDIKPSGGRVLLVLSPDKRVPPEDAERLFNAITAKNNFCVVTGDGTDLGKLEDKVRRIWATAKVLQEDGGDGSPNLTSGRDQGAPHVLLWRAAIRNDRLKPTAIFRRDVDHDPCPHAESLNCFGRLGIV
jgi:hypothetical protein